jgi:hypothetical protein
MATLLQRLHWITHEVSSQPPSCNYFLRSLPHRTELSATELPSECSTDCFTASSQSQSYITTDGQSASQPVYLGIKHPSGAYDHIFITVRLSRVCWCGGLSLKRERVCRLQLLLVLACAVILGSESRGTRDHILLSQIRDSPNLEDHVPVFICLRNRVAQLYPQALGPLFVASYDSQGYGGGIRTRLHVTALSDFPCQLSTFGTDHTENLLYSCRGVFTSQLPSNQSRRVSL